MVDGNYSGSGSSSGSVTTLLMVVAVIAVAVAAFNVYRVAQTSATGFASSDRGNVTFEIESQIHIIFTNNLINWSTGFVDTDGTPSLCIPGVEAQLSTDPTGEASSPTGIFCGVNWIPVLQGLTLQSASNQDILVNLTSNQNALNLIDGGTSFGSSFQWKVSNNKTNTCNIDGTGLAPTTYTEIVQNGNVTICNSMNWGPGNNALDIDFLVNISSSASVTGERRAIITATAERGIQNTSFN